jgi:hypothetical protein
MDKIEKKLLTHPKWWIEGLLLGLFMFVINDLLLNPLILGTPITLKKLLIGIPIWTIGGLFYGLTMKRIRESKRFK